MRKLLLPFMLTLGMISPVLGQESDTLTVSNKEEVSKTLSVTESVNLNNASTVFSVSGQHKKGKDSFGGFIDVTDSGPSGIVGINHEFSKKITGKIEYILNSSSEDELALGVGNSGEIIGIEYNVMIYPVNNTGLDGDLLVGIQKELNKFLSGSTFLRIDIRGDYYGETALLTKLNKNISLQLLAFYGGNIDDAIRPNILIGTTIKIK